MYLEFIPEGGKFYKVNMHCHTNISDGTRSPEQVKEFYKKAGYSAIAFTDHEILIDHKDLCDDEFVALHGYEVAIKKDLAGHTAYFMPVYHFNFIAKSQDNLKMPLFFKNNPSCPGNSRKWMDEYAQYDTTIDTTKYDIDWINNYLKGVKEGGFLINYNHPQWSLQNCDDYLPLEHLHSIELMNGGCFLQWDNTAIHFEQMLRAGKKVVPTAGDDNHHERGSLKAWTMIKADELSYDALISAYERGDCYVSDGPEIHSLVLKDGKIIVKTSASPYIVLASEGRYVQGKISRTEKFTEAVFDYAPQKMGSYFRIEVRDSEGRKAFSNAYYTDRIEKSLAKDLSKY